MRRSFDAYYMHHAFLGVVSREPKPANGRLSEGRCYADIDA